MPAENRSLYSERTVFLQSGGRNGTAGAINERSAVDIAFRRLYG
jgi:hypothetical protein